MGSWQIEIWEEQDALERRAKEIETVARAFEEVGGAAVTVHDPLVFPDRTLLRVTGEGAEFWYESGGRSWAHAWAWLPDWRAYLAAVETRANELLELMEDDTLDHLPDASDPFWHQ